MRFQKYLKLKFKNQIKPIYDWTTLNQESWVQDAQLNPVHAYIFSSCSRLYADKLVWNLK